ncbi:hypothetical protein OSSY52_08470 [Tepiditoga spiralis]|uniref:DUF401 family protein n=1 Tax=Tepiditoga spiralis TaxID=2108365 RepID=A0A7G1G5W2_9BACT|nr:DUF401 family protein [Tepiditoga spiralis]BBE30706.1 hypothetical protein OSSY52_08470 [Tepiditoga spiralis]
MATLSILLGFLSLIITIKFFKKVYIGVFSALLTTAFIFFKPSFIVEGFIKTISGTSFYELIIIVTGIYLISDTMKISENSNKFAENIHSIFNSKQAIAFMPMFLGLLPMPGGAMFTAPMVKDIAEEKNIDNLTAASMNYWFRHLMEFFWILYPAVILFSSLTNIKITKILLINIPTGVFAFIGGWIFFKVGKIKFSGTLENWKNLLKSLIPIIAVMIGVILSIPGWIVVLVVSISYAIYYKNFSGLVKIKWEILILLLLVFSYKNFVELSGLSKSFVNELQSMGLSPWWIIILAPLTLGMITGITQAAFAVTMPLTVSLVTAGVLPLMAAGITTYYFSVVGVLLSPVHLCLLLTSDFFEVKMENMIKKILIPMIFSSFGYLLMMFILLK